MTSTDHTHGLAASARALAVVSLGGVVATPFIGQGMMFASVCLMIIGIWALVAGQWRWQEREKPGTLVISVFAFYAFGSAAISLSRGDDVSQLEQYLPFLGAGLLGIGFGVSRLRLQDAGAAFALGAGAAAAACMWQVSTAHGMHRAELAGFSTWLGTAGALYAAFCAGLATWCDVPRRTKFLWIAGACSGAIVALLSGSKGSWLVLAAIAIAVLPANLRRLRTSGRFLVLGAALACIALGVFLPNSPVWARIKEASEVGDRLRSAYWHEAVTLFSRSPILGAGRAAIREKLHQAMLQVRRGIPLEENPNDAHNEYLDILAARGSAGLLLTLAALTIPFFVFWRMRKGGPASGPARTGLLFIVAFAIAGLTDVQFAVNMKRMLYLYVVMFLLAAATQEGRNSAKE